MQLPDTSLSWPIALAGVALIAESEGCRLRAYKCPAGVWTCGWGETEGVTPGTNWTQRQADERLCESLRGWTAKVRALLTEHANEHQLGAMVSLAYNIGAASFAKSTVLRQHNAGNFEAAARAFSLWDKARNPRSGKLEPLPGLVSRRAAEAALYLKPLPDEPQQPMPQAVAAESSLAASPIAQGGAATATAGGALALTSVGDQAQQAVGALGSVKSVAAALRGAIDAAAGAIGVTPQVLLAIVLVAAGVAVLRWRWLQRKGGWA